MHFPRGCCETLWFLHIGKSISIADPHSCRLGDNAWIKKYFDPKFCSRVGKGPLVEATDKGIAKLVG